MFSGFMVNAWIVATLVAITGGAVGFFIVMRGSAFVAHAIPNGSFAGAACAGLVGVSTLLGLGVFSIAGALGLGLMARRGRQDVSTALALVFMLGLGALFLSFSTEYEPELMSLLFGEVLGISNHRALADDRADVPLPAGARGAVEAAAARLGAARERSAVSAGSGSSLRSWFSSPWRRP